MIKFSDHYHKAVKYLTDNRRVDWLFITTIAGLIASLLLTFSAWSTNRTYPLSPIITDITLTPAFQSGLFILILLSLLSSLAYPPLRRELVGIALATFLGLVLLDITRLQPWALHYSAILLLFSLYIPKKFLFPRPMLDAARIIVAGIYFWSGLQKLNVRFFSEIFPWFTEHLWSPFHENGASVALFVGLLVPIIEAAFAVGFFTKSYRNISIVGSTIMIVLVFASIGPTGQSWNSSVWPWNIAIYGMVLILFLGEHTTLRNFIQRQKKNYLAWGAFLLFWLVPAGNLFGVTDHYLSWSLYSGRVPEATIIGDQAILEQFSPLAKDGKLTFVNWTQTDMNLVPYPEERVFQEVFKKICVKHPNLQLQIITPRLFVSNKHTETISNCPNR